MRTFATILSLFFVGSAFANGVDDARVSFSTKGPDCYADGSVVMDGECYALIWSKDGNFNGFDANGECIDPEDKIVLLAPVAKNGRCPPVLFQIPAAEAENLKNGQYAVYLLDTRVSSGGETKAIIAAMRSLRKTVDAMENLVADDRWPLPKYREMLFVY